MKARFILMCMMLSLWACESHAQHSQHDPGTFKSERISKTASYVVDAPIDKVWPLYGAFEERKWAEGWDPQLVYPDQEVMAEGTSFKTSGHGHEALWIVTKFEPEKHLVQYLVSDPDRYWTITVKSESSAGQGKTRTTVTYAFTSLSQKGHDLNQRSLNHMYQNDLQDWADALNKYLNE